MQRMHEVVFPVHHADHIAIDFRDEESRAHLVDVAYRLAALAVGRGGFGRQLRQPGERESFVEDGFHRVEVVQPPGPDVDAGHVVGAAHRSTASTSVSLISSMTT
jgi:hypothetical protein